MPYPHQPGSTYFDGAEAWNAYLDDKEAGLIPEREPQPEPCAACNGEGELEISDPQRDDPYYARVVRCENCNGSGNP